MLEIIDFNFSENLAYCGEFVDNLLKLLYYSHIPTAIIALLAGVFVYTQNKKDLLAKILLSISLVFSLWAFLDLAIWINYDKASVLMFSWAPIEIFSVLLFELCLYFVYVFITKKDAPIIAKIGFALLLLPIIIAAPTTSYLTEYDLQECVALESPLFLSYVFYLKLILSVIILGFGIYKFFEAKSQLRKQISLLTIGILGFIFAFFIAGQISERTGNYTFEIYGLFGMIVFVAFLAYLIVKFQAFNIKVLGVQMLVAGLVALIGTQYTFIDGGTAIILNTITVLLTLVFGYLLIRSVEREIKQRERIEKLAQDLEKANTRLRELDQLKSQFLSFASHQIRAPLTAIDGYASMLLEGDFGEVPPKIMDQIGIIDQSSKSLIKIVNEFLDVSRIEQGRMKYELTDFDAEVLAREVVAELRPNVEKKGLSFEYKANPGQYMVRADRGKIKQVIGNIVDNSIKYTPKGGITVSVGKSSDHIIRFSITDTGVGIAPEETSKLFSMFSRAKDASKTNVSGTGLGLYVAKQMVEAHKGRVWVESDGKGKGSTFYIEIPGKEE
jgi:signal transduction histidine kinase